MTNFAELDREMVGNPKTIVINIKVHGIVCCASLKEFNGPIANI